jgi:hypothetical protein
MKLFERIEQALQKLDQYKWAAKFQDRHLSGRPLFCASLGLHMYIIYYPFPDSFAACANYSDYTTLNFASTSLIKLHRLNASFTPFQWNQSIQECRVLSRSLRNGKVYVCMIQVMAATEVMRGFFFCTKICSNSQLSPSCSLLILTPSPTLRIHTTSHGSTYYGSNQLLMTLCCQRE